MTKHIITKAIHEIFNKKYGKTIISFEHNGYQYIRQDAVQDFGVCVIFLVISEVKKECNNFKGSFDINGQFTEAVEFLPLKFYFDKLIKNIMEKLS